MNQSDQSYEFTHGVRMASLHRVEVIPMDPAAATEALTAAGLDGWRLVSCFPVPLQQSRLAGQDQTTLVLYCVLTKDEQQQYEMPRAGGAVTREGVSDV